MADSDGGQTNLAMDVGDLIDDGISAQPNADQMLNLDVGKTSDLTTINEELNLRVDKLANDENVNSAWLGANDGSAAVEVGAETTDVAFNRQRPFSASTRSRVTVASSRSRVSMSPSITTSDFTSNNLFSHKSEIFNKALAQCSDRMVLADPDGAVQGSWLLTEIDHWNNEKERIVLLTENSLLIIKYDFIKECSIEGKRIPLIAMNKLQIGDLVYPAGSLMRNRDYGGVRIFHGDPDSTTFAQRWNPWSRTMPYITLTHHILAYNRHESETVTYNAEDMAESLVIAVDAARRRFVGEVRDVDRIVVEDNPIVIDSYISLASIIHNQSKLGFYLERGGVSF